jgi:Spy/CpxP family protein refolding chaperone
MNVKPLLKVSLCLAGIFLLGSVCGVAMSGHVGAARRPTVAGGGQWIERWLDRRMANDFAVIQATPEQQQELRGTYDDLRADLDNIRQDAKERVTAAISRHRQNLWAKLTPEQRKDLWQATQDRRLRYRESLREAPSE